MEDQLKIIKDKANILVDAIPYFRDFNQKIVVIGYLCSNILSGEEEQEIMKDVTLLKSVGMKPVIVHDSRMGADKFRENKRLAKLVELNGVKAIGICGIDEQTLHMTVDNNYIPVITPNDIDTEQVDLTPEDTARKIAVLLNAEKLIYIGKEEGIISEKTGEKLLSMKESELRQCMDEQQFDVSMKKMLENAIKALDGGVKRVHFINARLKHALLLELYSVFGVGTVIVKDDGELYPHEVGRR